MPDLKDELYVIGSCGYLCRHLVEEALQNSSNWSSISCYDIVGDQLLNKKQSLPSNFAYHQIREINDFELHNTTSDKQIIYCVLSSNHLLELTNLSDGYVSDMQVLCRLLERLAECHNIYITYLSSAAVYGNTRGLINEDTSTIAINPYSLMKLHSEQILQYWGRYTGHSISILRLFQSFGYGQAVNNVIGKLISCASTGESVQLNERGSQIRTILYIQDLISAVLVKPRKCEVQIYNIGSNEEISLKKFADLIGCSYELIGDENKNNTIIPDISKAKRLLGWSPKNSINDVLKLLNNSEYSSN